MQQLKPLKSKEKKNILRLLESQFGYCDGLDYEIFINPKDKLFLISKDMARIDMAALRVNSLGLYFGELNRGELRLSIEGSQMIGIKATKNVILLDDESAEFWMDGQDFDIDSDINGFVILKHNDDILGCGRIINKRMLNYVPKERRSSVSF